MTLGYPPAGAGVSGTTIEQASFAPSEAAIVSCCGVAPRAVLLQPRATSTTTKRKLRRPTTGDSVTLLYDHRVDSRPVGVFDSGVGGLTVLHECLVTLPHEDFVYLGDHARLPYGPRPLAEVRSFAREIGAYLQAEDVKLIVVACNTATSAALPQLQEELTVPVVGVVSPEAHAAVQATRNRRVGLLATQGTVDGGRYGELIHALDAGVSVWPLACPRLVPLIEGDDPYGAATETAVREYAAPLKEAGVDTVILGCTHYPLIRPVFQRVFGRDVTLVFSAEETAREVAETLARKGIENESTREGSYRFLTTGDPAAFAEMGRRFLQLPIGEVEHVTPAQLGAAA
jgi:glutamate racemase